MSKPRTVARYTSDAIEKAGQMSRENYKAVKHMDKVQLTDYLRRLYRRGYEDGINAMAEQIQSDSQDTPNAAATAPED